MNRLQLPALFLLLTWAAVLRAQSPYPDYIPVSMVQTEEATFPPDLVVQGVKSGAATVAVAIDEQGHLVDYLVTGYTEPGFADHAVAALKHWKFEAAQIHGHPRDTKADISFDFVVKGTVVVSLTPLAYSEMLRNRLDGNPNAYRASTLAQLDHIPTPSKIVKPAYTPAVPGSGRGGKLTVEFYIDETGKVRLPSVDVETSEAYEDLSAVAIAAVTEWQFEPPTAKGRPVLVLAHQDFTFQPLAH